MFSDTVIAKASLRFYILTEISQFVLLTAFAHWLIPLHGTAGAAQAYMATYVLYFALCCGAFLIYCRKNDAISRAGLRYPASQSHAAALFNDVMSVESPADAPRRFMVVSAAPDTLLAYPQLQIDVYPSKRALAQAVIARAADRRQRFFFHGQFNPRLWLALLSGKLRRQQAFWHVWGADLYEEGAGLKYRLFYLLRRIARGAWRRCLPRAAICTFQQRHPRVPTSLLYFPTRMPEAAIPAPAASDSFTILLGNSGDRSNRHIEGLQAIRRQFGEQVNVVIPLGYPASNYEYIDEIDAAAQRLFPRGGDAAARQNRLHCLSAIAESLSARLFYVRASAGHRYAVPADSGRHSVCG